MEVGNGCGIDGDDMPYATQFLHHLGSLQYYPETRGDLRKWVFLDPQWFVQNYYYYYLLVLIVASGDDVD